MRGMHGYDNTDPDMRAIFLASGPGKSLFMHKSQLIDRLDSVLRRIVNILAIQANLYFINIYFLVHIEFVLVT